MSTRNISEETDHPYLMPHQDHFPCPALHHLPTKKFKDHFNRDQDRHQDQDTEIDQNPPVVDPLLLPATQVEMRAIKIIGGAHCMMEIMPENESHLMHKTMQSIALQDHRPNDTKEIDRTKEVTVPSPMIGTDRHLRFKEPEVLFHLNIMEIMSDIQTIRGGQREISEDHIRPDNKARDRLSALQKG